MKQKKQSKTDMLSIMTPGGNVYVDYIQYN